MSNICKESFAPRKRKSIKQRLLSSVIKNDTTQCWEWQLQKSRDGYGKMTTRRKSDGKHLTRRAHRVSYRVFVGKIPKGLIILHKCDNPICINPQHLYVGTISDNAKDMYSKGRGHNNFYFKKENTSGEYNVKAKLSNEDVLEIRNKKNKETPLKVLAERYGVASNTISSVRNYKTWKHIKE